MHSIILASRSARRKQLLEMADFNFTVIVKHIDETIPEGIATHDIPVYLAKQKGIAVKNSIEVDYMTRDYETWPVLSADTMVEIEGKLLGKPYSRESAIEMLNKLSGKNHHVITGVCIIAQNKEYCFSDVTEVSFYDLKKEQIEYYVDKYQPYDKAGAYAIQEWIGVTGIKSICGDFYNVMGLPISRVMKTLEEIYK